MSQVPVENLPVEFGGTCKCPGGCELSDDGPWHDPQWAKPPKWALPKQDASVTKSEDASVEGKANGEEEVSKPSA